MQCASGAGGNGLIDLSPSAEMITISPGSHVALVGRADQIHRAGFRADHVGVAEAAERERAEAVRIADGDQPVLRQHHQRERALHLRHRFDDRVLDAARLRSRVEVQDHFGVAVRLEDRSLLHEIVAQLARVDDVAVVAERDLAVRAVDQDRLRVEQLALARPSSSARGRSRSVPAASTASRRRRCRRRSPSRARCAPAAPSDAAMPALSWPRCCSA